MATPRKTTAKAKPAEKPAAPAAAKQYTVLVEFRDGQDSDHLYKVGDTYPREGQEPAQERIDLLASERNATGRKIIE